MNSERFPVFDFRADIIILWELESLLDFFSEAVGDRELITMIYHIAFWLMNWMNWFFNLNWIEHDSTWVNESKVKWNNVMLNFNKAESLLGGLSPAVNHI